VEEAFQQDVIHTWLMVNSLLPRLSHVIQLSTADVYAPASGFAVTENHALRPSSYYGVVKLAAEQVLRVWAEKTGARLTILRLTHVFGPGDRRETVMPTFVRRALAGVPLFIRGSGQETRDFLFVTDAARAVLSVVQHSRGGTYNIASGRPVTIQELGRLVLRLCDRSESFLHVESAGAPVGRSLRLDNSLANHELHYAPMYTLEGGLTLTVDHYRRGMACSCDM
jgi:UDP-glucose 4-epimerase